MRRDAAPREMASQRPHDARAPQVCGGECLQLFRWEELELLICGSPVLDFEALERVTQYDDGYSRDHPTIVMLWQARSHWRPVVVVGAGPWLVVARARGGCGRRSADLAPQVIHEFPLELKKRFLFFSTGSDRVPIKGLSNLNFVISRQGTDEERLPSAHTCFNHLLLPEYQQKEKLYQQLYKAISDTEGFHII